LLVFILAINLIISAAAMAFTSYFLYFIGKQGLISDNSTVFMINAGFWVTILLTSLISFSSIFYLAPAKRGIFPFFSAGSVVASVLSVAAFKIFIIFIENFSHVNTFYGSLGTLIVILMWINLTAMMLLIGFELNASIYEAEKNGLTKK
jgi:membrane protein